MADAAGRWPPKRQIPLAAWITLAGIIVTLLLSSLGAVWHLSGNISELQSQVASHERRLGNFERGREKYIEEFGDMKARIKSLEDQSKSHYDRPWQ